MNAMLEQFGAALHPAWVTAVNEWLVSRPDFIFNLGEREMAMKWLPASLVTMNLQVNFECQGFHWQIALDNLRAFDPRLIGEPFTNLPSDTRTLVVKKLLMELFSYLPPELSENIDVLSVDWGRVVPFQEGKALPFSLINITQRTQTNGVLCVNNPDALNWLNQNMPQGRAMAKPAIPTQKLNYATRLNIGTVELGVEQLKFLEVGDLVWIETASLSAQGIKAWFELHLHQDKQAVAFHGYMRQQSLIIKKTTPCNYKKISSQDNKLPRNFTETIGVHIETGQLELPVTFDLGELTLSLADIERIGPNYVFELPQEVADTTINMRVNGTLIAQGRLMVVGRRLGVRVTNVCQIDGPIQSS